MASKDNLIYLEVSNSTGEGVSRLFDVALIEAAEVNDERYKKTVIQEADTEEEEEEKEGDGTVAKNSASRLCTIL